MSSGDVLPTTHVNVPMPSGVACRGSWVLGTACGRCDRCRDEAVARVPQLLAAQKALEQRMKVVYLHVPAPCPVPGIDYADDLKVRMYDALRCAFHGKKETAV